MGGIFVSYRRSDSQGEAGRLFDDLVNHFGEHTVFMDVAGIEAGRDFRKAIEDGVAKCGVLLVVMGPQWLNAKDESGARRIHEPGDFVHIETASALRRDIPVIPVLVRGAEMPRADQLPEDLKDLAYRNCVELTHVRWRSDVQLLIEALRRVVGDTTQSGTKSGPTEATAQAQPGTARQEAAGSSELEKRNSARIDPAAVQRVSRELALHIGPIAGVVVGRAAARCTSVEDLYLTVAEEIDSPDEREKFLLKRAPIRSTPLADVVEAAALVSDTSGTLGSSPLLGLNDAPFQTALPVTGTRRSSRWKYLLLIGGAGIFLILALVLGPRFAPQRSAGPSQTAQSSAPDVHAAESAPVKTGIPPPTAEIPKSDEPTRPPATPVADESEPKSSQRVRVPEKVSQGLLIKETMPVYPLLARQARVQGRVVLIANISKDGEVEALKAMSGHPMLIPAAIEAVKQWRYKPYMLNGVPVAVNTQIVVNFALSGG